MKKLFLFIFVASLAISTYSQKRVSYKAKDIIGNITYAPDSSKFGNPEKDSVIIHIALSESIAVIQIQNNTSGRITVEWENVKMNGYGILFSETRMFETNFKKPDEVIFSGQRCEHTFLPKYMVNGNEVSGYVISKKEVFKNGPKFNDFIVPIRFSNFNRDYRLIVKSFKRTAYFKTTMFEDYHKETVEVSKQEYDSSKIKQ